MCFDAPVFATDYDKKKYIWKLLYIYMLGYDVEFGHKQACDLIPAGKYVVVDLGWMVLGRACICIAYTQICGEAGWLHSGIGIAQRGIADDVGAVCMRVVV